MIIVRTTWAQVPDGTLVVSPATGRIMTMVKKVTLPGGGPAVELSDPDHDAEGDFVMRTVPVDPHAPIDMVETGSDLSRAIDVLSQSFALKRM
jgi:hypothetical protein